MGYRVSIDVDNESFQMLVDDLRGMGFDRIVVNLTHEVLGEKSVSLETMPNAQELTHVMGPRGPTGIPGPSFYKFNQVDADLIQIMTWDNETVATVKGNLCDN